MNEIIYLKKVQDYKEIIKFKKLEFLNKFVLLVNNIFSLINKKKINDINIWILPFKNEIKNKKLEKIIIKQIKKKNINENTKIVLSNNLKKKEVIDILEKYNIKYIKENLAKKQLILKLLEYINKLQEKKQNERDITILTNEVNDVNIRLITRLALESKNIKIVSKYINKFRALEKKLYNEKGIAIQFSNSYKKSLKKADIIINLDFSEVEINEYEINPKAIIINIGNKLKIKAKYFNGIVINSYNIDFIKLPQKLDNILNLLKEFNKLDIYESIFNDNNFIINKKNIKIVNVRGNNGAISANEFKNIL